MISVRELAELALPPGTLFATGDLGLNREVTWVTRPRPSPPAFDHLRGGELVLLGANALANFEETIALGSAVRRIAAFGVAAIAYAGDCSAEAREAARELGIAVLQLPPETDLGVVEREAAHLLLERRRDLQRRGQDAGRRLMELAIAGEPLTAIVETLAGLTGQAVALEGRDRRLHQYQPPGPQFPARDLVERWLAVDDPEFASWLRRAVVSSPAEPPTAAMTIATDWRRVAAPIIGRDGLLGILSLIGPAGRDPGDLSQLASRGAAACAVVMTREYATLAARREIEINVLDEVLDGALRSELTLLQQAKRLGHDLTAPHLAIVARIESSGAIEKHRDERWRIVDEVVARRNRRWLWRIRHNSAELICPAADLPGARSLADQFYADIHRRLNGSPMDISVGTGRLATGLAGIQRSYREAKQALIVGRQLHGTGQLTRFDDLGVYRLLFAAGQLPELREFRDESIGPLIAYDRQHHADLVETLRAYFDANCSPKEAAAALGVHRNTVLYRIERIQELTGLDLSDSDVRLRLHLALCADYALGPIGE